MLSLNVVPTSFFSSLRTLGVARLRVGEQPSTNPLDGFSGEVQSAAAQASDVDELDAFDDGSSAAQADLDEWLHEFRSESTPDTVGTTSVQRTANEPKRHTWMNEFAPEGDLPGLAADAATEPQDPTRFTARDRWLREFEAGRALIESKRAMAMRRTQAAAGEEEAPHDWYTQFEVAPLSETVDLHAVPAPAARMEIAAAPVIAPPTPAIAAAPVQITATPMPVVYEPPVVEAPSMVPTAPIDRTIVVVEHSMQLRSQAPEPVAGDYDCPKCLFKSLRREATRCAMCHADVPAEFWAPILDHERQEADARARVVAREEEERAELAKKMASEWTKAAPQRERRARLAAQKAERRRQLEFWNLEAAAAQLRGKHEWQRFFWRSYFAYVLPTLMLLSMAAMNASVQRDLPFWVSALTPGLNWISCIYVLADSLLMPLPAVLPQALDVTRTIQLMPIAYPTFALLLWSAVGVGVGAIYPVYGQARVVFGPVPQAPVRPSGAILALAIAALVLGVALTLDGSALTLVLTHAGDVFAAFGQ